MNAKHAFKPTSFDTLEAREVMSHASVVHAAAVHHVAAAKAAVAHTYAAQLAAFTKANAFTTKGAAVTPFAVTAGTTMTNVSSDLSAVYSGFQSNGGNASALAAQYPNLRFSGNSVGVEVKTTAAGFNAELTQLRNLGMTVSLSSAAYGLIEGYIPITALPNASALPGTVAITPNYKPVTNAPVATTPTTTAPTPAASTASLANTSNDLKSLYASFQANGGNAAALAAQYSTLRISGNSVGVDVKTNAAGFNALVSELTNLGMTITTSSAAYGLVEGYLPITALPTASALPQTISINPNYKPVTNGGYHL